MPHTPDFADSNILPARWASFLDELDGGLNRPVEMHCLGAFVLTVCWGVARDTADIDVLSFLPPDQASSVLQVAGRGSSLSKGHSLYVEKVTVADHPDGYEDRLVALWPNRFRHLRLKALDIHDLVLAKLTRNSRKDRFDVRALAQDGALDVDVLRQRYREEMRPYLANEERHDLTLKLWVEEYFPQ